MSAPVVPQRSFDPESVTDWINVLHNANAVPRDAPDYAEARQVVEQALQQIGHLNRQASAADREAQNFQPVNPVLSGLAGAAHGASFGVGEPIAGVIDAATGGSFREGAGRYREGLERAAVSNPATFAASEFGGQVAPISGPAKGIVGGIQAGRPLTAGQILARIAKGAGTGATVGGIGGFSAGGEDPGSLEQRLEAAKGGAETGAVVGGILTGGGMLLGRRSAERAADLKMRGDQREAAALQVELLRKRLDDMGPDDLLPPPEPLPPSPIRPMQGPAMNQPRPAGPEIRGGFPRVRDAIPEQLSPSDLVDQLPAEMQTSRGGPGRVAPEPTVSPAAAVDQLPPEMQTSRGLGQRVTIPPELGTTVPAGPYQLAAPATRMQSVPAPSRIMEATANDPDLLQAQLELMRSLGQQEPNQASMEALAKLIAARIVP